MVLHLRKIKFIDMSRDEQQVQLSSHYYDDIFDYKATKRQPLEVLIQKASSLKQKELLMQQQQMPQAARPQTSYTFYEPQQMRKGAQEALKLTQNAQSKHQPKKTRKPKSPKVKKDNVELALDKLRSTNSVHRQTRTPPPGSVYDTASSRKSPPPKRELTPKEANKIYSRLIEHEQQRQSQIQEQQHKKSQDDSHAFQPKISKKSKELAEQKFIKLKTAPNGINFLLNGPDKNARLLNVRSQQCQTDQNCVELIKKTYHVKPSKKQTPAPAAKGPSTNKKKVESVEAKEEPQAPSQKKEFSTQTEPFQEIPAIVVTTPKKAQPVEQNAKSGVKESNYVPLHERYQYIMEQQKDHMRKLLSEQEDREKRYQSQKKKDDDEDPFSERLEKFLENQSDWANRKQGRLMNEKVKRYQTQGQSSSTTTEPKKSVISKKSQQIIKAKFPRTFEERQQGYIEKKSLRIEQLQWELENPHHPIIAPKSRMICEQVSDRQLYRHLQHTNQSIHQ